MIGSAVLYSGLVLALLGCIVVVKPISRLGIRTRRHGLAVAGAGVALAMIAAVSPAPESSVNPRQTRLDEFAPAWQFREYHTIRIAAPPTRVFDAIKRVRADEIRLFRLLTWIRRGGQPLPESILNAGDRDALIDIATRSGFVRLADDAPQELVIGTVVVRPAGTRGVLRSEVFRQRLPPGFALAAMNFLVAPDRDGGSLVSTETRVFANSDAARRRFAVYWRLIYPGSAIIRRMWLRAIERRAEGGTG